MWTVFHLAPVRPLVELMSRKPRSQGDAEARCPHPVSQGLFAWPLLSTSTAWRLAMSLRPEAQGEHS